MNLIKTIITLNFSCCFACAEFTLPPDIAAGIAQSEIGESGGFGIRGVEEKRFAEYIKLNWREIVEHIENLPPTQSSYSNKPIENKQTAFNASAANFGAACEVLDPVEYLDFLDKWLDLYEQQRISDWTLERQVMGVNQKDNFLDVNWEHPRVKKLHGERKSFFPVSNTPKPFSKDHSPTDIYMVSRTAALYPRRFRASNLRGRGNRSFDNMKV